MKNEKLSALYKLYKLYNSIPVGVSFVTAKESVPFQSNNPLVG